MPTRPTPFDDRGLVSVNVWMGYCPAKRLRQSITPLQIACSTEAGYPLVVPLWFIDENGCSCSGSYRNAKLLSHLWLDERVGFDEITICLEPGHMSGRDYSPRMQDSH